MENNPPHVARAGAESPAQGSMLPVFDPKDWNRMAVLDKKDQNHDRARAELHRLLPREALVDTVSRGIYATDASIFEFMPIAVVTPRNEGELAMTLKVAQDLGVPVMPRGGGTSLAGQTCNNAIVMDVSKHLHHLLELNPDEKWARVEPGLVRDELNATLRKHNLEYAPETSTSNRAVLGGMIANNSSGMRSIRYKRSMDHVLSMRIMLPGGDTIDCVDRTPEEARRLAELDSPEGRIWKELIPLLEKNRSLIERKFPKVMRRVGGYSLDEFSPEGPWNLSKLIGGSEGTLATILEAKINLVEPPKHIGIVAIHYEELFSSFRSVPLILKYDPLSVELMDRVVVKLSKNNPATKRLCGFIEGEPGAILVTELTGDSEDEVTGKIESLEADLRAAGYGYAFPTMRTPESRGEVVELRKTSLGVMLSVRGDLKPIPFIEDACVPVEHLADYLERVAKVITDEELDYIMFGHASVGVIHVRPVLNQKDAAHVAKIEKISRQVVDLVKEYKGSWSGEHGDGVSRGAMNERFWGSDMIQVFRDVKAIFDPKGIMNPGRIFDSPPLSENLRFGGDYKVNHPTTYFRFEEFHGFGGAVEMCNGVGACRKMGSGTMCPSYMATRDEEATTRGRANALRLAISGKFGKDGLVSDRVHEVLDLCLECKACKTECPSNVDMSRMKSEHLAHYHEAKGTPLRARLFAGAPVSGRANSGLMAPLANGIMKIAPLRRAFFRMVGIARDRNMPAFASQRLEEWNKRHIKPKEDASREVVFFADCWANYYETEPGKWALRLLRHFGYKVHFVGNACCQRTRISKGFLAQARTEGKKTVAALEKFAKRGVPIVGIEPSCVSSLTDDLPDLVDNKADAEAVAKVALPIEEFFFRELREGRIEIPRQKNAAARYLVHGHCHQKAIFSTSPAKSLLSENAVVGSNGSTAPVEVTEVDSGCCGMAGSFGYEAEHYDISKKIGEMRLLPAVRAADKETVVVANGFSCRHQISDFGERKAVHVVEALGRAILGDKGDGGA